MQPQKLETRRGGRPPDPYRLADAHVACWGRFQRALRRAAGAASKRAGQHGGARRGAGRPKGGPVYFDAHVKAWRAWQRVARREGAPGRAKAAGAERRAARRAADPLRAQRLSARAKAREVRERERAEKQRRREAARRAKAAAREAKRDRAAAKASRPQDAHVRAWETQQARADAARSRALRAPKHDAHVTAYHKVGKALAEFVERMVRRNAKEAERRAKKLAAGVPEGSGRNRVKKLRRKHATERATPAWANRELIAEIYECTRKLTKETGEQWDVDHLVPLRHPLVCGLHVPANLIPMPRSMNVQKSNTTWPDMP